MLVNKLSLPNEVWIVFLKEFLCEYRTGYALATLLMFTLVTLSSIGISIAGMPLSPELTSVLLWIIIFFCAMAGLGRTFMEEQETGTVFTLRLYFHCQGIILGKMLYNITLLVVITCLIVILFAIFLQVEFPLWESLLLILLLGDIGIGVVSTLTAAMLKSAMGKPSLFTILTFPIVLPQFLNAINATAAILSGCAPTIQETLVMLGYDSIMIVIGYIFFEDIWYE